MAGQTVAVQQVTTSDTATSFCSKINANLAAIVAELARKVSPGDVSYTSDLSAQGHAISFLGRAWLEDAGLSYTDPGSLYYSAGEWFVVSAAGTVQITLNGQLNASSVGGIVGDYGGVNTAKVNYVHSTKTYQFTDQLSPTVWSNLDAATLILQAVSGKTLQIKADDGLTANSVWDLPSLPGSLDRHILTLSNDGTVRCDDIVTPATQFVNRCTFSAGVTEGADHKHTDTWTYRAEMLDFIGVTGINFTLSTPVQSGTATGNTYTARGYLKTWRAGDRIRTVTIVITKAGANSTSFVLKKVDQVTSAVTTIGTVNTSTPGTQTLTISVTPAAIGASESWYVEVANGNTGDVIADCRYTVDHP